jgi:hypothetical protein
LLISKIEEFEKTRENREPVVHGADWDPPKNWTMPDHE